MLNQLECEVVKNHKVHGFAAYLQGAWFEFPKLESNISKRNYPIKKDITEILDRMEGRQISFDVEYAGLSREAINPLKIEQEAWKLLSPKVSTYLEKFRQFLNSYSPEKVNDRSRGELLALTQEGWNLLQKWNIISKSYSPKYEIAIYGQTGWTERDIQEREETVNVLVQNLSSQ